MKNLNKGIQSLDFRTQFYVTTSWVSTQFYMIKLDVSTKTFVFESSPRLSALQQPTVTQAVEPNENSVSHEQTDRVGLDRDPADISNNTGPLVFSDCESSAEVNQAVDGSLANLYVYGCRVMSDESKLHKLDPDPVAEGGHGFIYHGKLDEDEVAIKYPKIAVNQTTDRKRQLVQNAAYEALIWWQCDHPNIQKLTAVTRFDDQFAMISPWMRQGDLSKIITHHSLSWKDRFVLSTQVCDSVAYLHSLNISNILLSDNGIPKLADFGSAVKEGLPAPRREPIASLRWMPSEIWRGAKPSPQSDVYSLAMTILEIFTGAVPYSEVQGPAVIWTYTIRSPMDLTG
ncbi:tyrosine kinase domain protein, partial [Rhizoctonia solani AG-3 Rhs1AP]